MRPQNFEQSNCLLAPPEDMRKDCVTLSTHYEPEEHYHISKWVPSEEEIEHICAGRPVWLYVYGAGHPPVALQTINPFTENGS